MSPLELVGRSAAAPAPTSAPAPTPAPAPAPTPAAAGPAATGWTLLPTLVVRSAGFDWQLLEGLRHAQSAATARRLCAALERAEQLSERLPRELPRGVRLTRGQAARLRNNRPLPAQVPLPDRLREAWDAAAGDVAQREREWADAEELQERGAGVAIDMLLGDPRLLDAVVCSSPAVYRDLTRGKATSGRLRRQLASYVQRLATKCETMGAFGPINYALVDPDASEAGALAWRGPQACADRRAFLSAWAFDRMLAAVLAEPDTTRRVVPRRCTFVGTPAGVGAVARLVRAADGVRDLADLADAVGLTLADARAALDGAVTRGLLTHDLVPPAVVVDQTRWLARRLAECPVPPPAGQRLVGAVRDVLAEYPRGDAATKLRLQTEVQRLLEPGADGSPAPAPAPDEKFYHDRGAVTEAAVGTVELTIGGGLARDLRVAVPVALDLLAGAAVETRRRAGAALARRLGPGRFPLTTVLRTGADLSIPGPPRLTAAVARLLAGASADQAELDLTGMDLTDMDLTDMDLTGMDLTGADRTGADLIGADLTGADGAGPGGVEPDLPVLCSADVMVAVDDLNRYREGQTLLVVGDVHDAALLTPWALQFHPDAAGVLADRDRQIERALGPLRSVGVIARRRTGLPPLRFPGAVVEFGTVDGPAERLPLDRLEVHSDGHRVRLRRAAESGDLFLHNGELDTAVQTALALPRVRPLAVPDLPHVPRLRVRNVVLSRRRWRLRPGPLDSVPAGPATARQRLRLRRELRRLAVPDRFFAKASHQRKPVFVDLDSPLLVDVLHRLADGAHRVHAGEVLPDRDGSWLREGDSVVAAELRCVYLRPTAQGGPR